MRLQSNLDEKVARDQRRSKKVNFWREEGSRLLTILFLLTTQRLEEGQLLLIHLLYSAPGGRKVLKVFSEGNRANPILQPEALRGGQEKDSGFVFRKNHLVVRTHG